LPYTATMRTVSETPIFVRYAREIWTEGEREEFVNWIAANPESGDIMPRSGGCRKVRWSASGRGKKGGARVIYFLSKETSIWLLIVYTKAKFDNLPTEFLIQLKAGVENAN
jgi:mRNA-degrading endonuclease RelE of RelBE toxin-antitoxin system